MSVQSAPSSAPTQWQPIGELVAEFRTECSDFEHVVSSLFDQLDQMRAEVDRKMHDLERERLRVAERERQLADQRKETSRIAHQFEHQEAKLSEALTELDELKGLIRRQSEDAALREAHVESSLQKQVEGLQRERQQLIKQLHEAQTEITRQAADARALAAAHQEIAELRIQLEAAADGRVVYPSSGGGLSDADQRRLSELEQERAALEAELELVRSRAAELFDTLAEERRALHETRNENSAELKQLRRLMERQGEIIADRNSGPYHPPAASHHDSSPPPGESDVDPDESGDAPPPSDPVINSVMAQFAKLQKEVAERRKSRKK